MESFKELEEGKTPGPMVEIEFWDTRHANMQNLHEQLCRKSTQSIVSILKHTKSGYYSMFRLVYLKVNLKIQWSLTIFRNLYRHVVSKLNEAQDISMHLKTLVKPLKVNKMHNSFSN